MGRAYREAGSGSPDAVTSGADDGGLVEVAGANQAICRKSCLSSSCSRFVVYRCGSDSQGRTTSQYQAQALSAWQFDGGAIRLLPSMDGLQWCIVPCVNISCSPNIEEVSLLILLAAVEVGGVGCETAPNKGRARGRERRGQRSGKQALTLPGHLVGL